MDTLRAGILSFVGKLSLSLRDWLASMLHDPYAGSIEGCGLWEVILCSHILNQPKMEQNWLNERQMDFLGTAGCKKKKKIWQFSCLQFRSLSILRGYFLQFTVICRHPLVHCLEFRGYPYLRDSIIRGFTVVEWWVKQLQCSGLWWGGTCSYLSTVWKT